MKTPRLFVALLLVLNACSSAGSAAPIAPSPAPIQGTVCYGLVTAGPAHVPLTIDLSDGASSYAMDGKLNVSPAHFSLSAAHPRQLIAIKDLGYDGSFGLVLKSCPASVELDFVGAAHGPIAHAVARIGK